MSEVSGERISAHALMERGGEWLGVARNWIKWNCRNGERVTWGSTDALERSFTVADVEQLASQVAAAAMNEWRSGVERLRRDLTVAKEERAIAVGRERHITIECDELRALLEYVVYSRDGLGQKFFDLLDEDHARRVHVALEPKR